MTRGNVPFARRTLFQDRRRAGLAAGGVGVALVLVLVMNGIFAGTIRQVTTYIRGLPAEAIISQQSVKTMGMATSTLPVETVAEARSVPGVAWAEPLRYATNRIVGPSGRQFTFVFGYEPQGRAGPHTIVRGRPPRNGEALLDKVGAARMGARIGDTVQILGAAFRVSGLSRGLTSVVNTTAFITSEDYIRLRGPAVSYVLVGASPAISAATLVDRLQRALPATTVQTRHRFADEEAGIVKMASDLMGITTVIAFLVALAVIGLTLFTMTWSKLREYAVVKSLGSSNGAITAIVLRQAAWSVGTALALAVALSVALAALVGRTGTLQIAIEPSSVLRTGVGALVVAALGSLIPIRRVLKVDPASAFRSAS